MATKEDARVYVDETNNIINRHYSNLADAIVLFPDILFSLSNGLYQHGFIDLHAKSSINRSVGLPGASMLLDHVMMKIEQSDQYIPLVMDILREEAGLEDIVQIMEDHSNAKMRDVILTTPPNIPAFNSDDDPPIVADVISSTERLKYLFESLCFVTMMVLSTASGDLLTRLKLKIGLSLQYVRDNTPEVEGLIVELEQSMNGQSFMTLLINKNFLRYLNFDLLDSIRPVLSSDEFDIKLKEYKLAHEQFFKNRFCIIIEVFQQKPNLRPAFVTGLPVIKVRLENKWKGRSLYDWNEVMNDIIQWGQYIMITKMLEEEMDYVTITYQILPFILPRVITDLTNDTIKEQFTSIRAMFIVPDEIQTQAMADHKWIMDTIQKQQDQDHIISKQPDTKTDQPLEEEGGYNDELFLTTPPSDLQCPVCYLTLREPYQLSCCGSALCQVCSERSNAGIQCPCCRDTNHQIMVDKKTRRRVMSLQVKCSVTQCHWTGELLDWNKHITDNHQWKSICVPEWCYHGLSSLQYEILPVYRTIKHLNKHKRKLYTNPFYTSNGGYKATLCVYPNGRDSSKGTHVSVLVNLMKGPNDDNLRFPINGIFTVRMLNWKEDHHHIEESIVFDDDIPIKHRKRVTRRERAKGWGCHNFLSHTNMASMSVLRKDMMCFRISYTPIIQTGCSPVPRWYDVMYSTVTTPPCTRTMYSYTAYKKTNSTWLSQPFYSTDNGYKLQLNVDANGYGSGEGTHLSLYVCLMKGDYDDTLLWPFNANITVQILNWSSDNHHKKKTIDHHKAPLEHRQRVVNEIIAPGGWGCKFISHTKLQDTSDNTVIFINNDNICFRIISVDIVN